MKITDYIKVHLTEADVARIDDLAAKLASVGKYPSRSAVARALCRIGAEAALETIATALAQDDVRRGRPSCAAHGEDAER